MTKKIDVIRIVITILITSIIMSTSSITIYGAIAKPQFYSHFMQLGNKYLSEGMYEEAILEFNKAIKIESKSTKARIGLAKGSIEINDIDTAVRALKEAQKLDFENTDLLIEIIDILKDADPLAAYEILMNYVNKKGEDNLNSTILQLLNSSKEEPQIPEVIPASGTYISPFILRLKSDKVRVGHTFYYTLDGTEPNDKSTQYRGGIKIEKETGIRLIGYNPSGKKTEIFEANYKIDNELYDKITEIIKTSKAEMNKTKVGTEVGNCIEGAKEELNAVIDKAEKMMRKNAISIETGTALYENLNDALYTFRQKIIVPTNRTALQEEISKAEKTVQNATEGNNVGQYRSGAKDGLNNDIKIAKIVLENIIARQENIDEATEALKRAIDRFNGKKITEIDKIIESTGAKIGPVTVSLLWNTVDDLDLHVTSPKGDTIYFSNKHGSSGGQLDVDRQVNTYVDHPVENIYWQNAPHGTYTVKVNVYSKRTDGNIPFQVRTIVDGEAKLYNMSVNSGTTSVCTFNY